MPDSDSPRAAPAAHPTDVEASPDDDPLPATPQPALTADLRAAFEAANWTVDAVTERLGEHGHRALGRNHTIPGLRSLAGDEDPVATLTRLWPLQDTVGLAATQRALPGLVEPLCEAGFLTIDGALVRALVDIRPYGSDDGFSGWIAADLTPGLDGRLDAIADDYVLGVSPASSTMTQLAARSRVGTAVDLGTGCGVQSLHLARHADQVIATDVNPRALGLARFTFALNGIDVDVRNGSLYGPLGEQRVDQIVSNPPYVMAPPGSAHLTYREGGMRADDLVREVVIGGARRLNRGGTLQVLGNWAHPVDGSWQERLAGWLAGTGCAAHIVEREYLPVAEYVELWLADAGLIGTGGYRRAYEEWLDYFAAERIGGVGLGWIFLTRTDEADPDVVIEEWPHPVEMPIGPIAEQRPVRSALARCSDDELLTSRPILAADVVQETTGPPGQPDPAHVVLRQRRGFRRAVEVDTALGGILGACDGELRLGVIIDAVAGLLDTPAAPLRTETLNRIRPLITDGLLDLAENADREAERETA
ncbi:MAG: class I SAM-dependent methyltransferase [Propionibacteriales bacterium]|nr:class I SAM-dependent methyltransferase [Propionibacteriales bacterium]